MQKMKGLFSDIILISGIEDIGYHEIKDNTLKPLTKSKVGKISEEDWIKQHLKNTVDISTDPVLKTLMSTKRPVYIKDCTTNSTKALDSFSVRSVYMYPILKSGEVEGVIVLASIGEKKELSEETLNKCEELIHRYIN